MANNRMWLIHKPSKLGVMLGKRMAWGWYAAPSPEYLEKFYDHIIRLLEDGLEGSQDDFILAQEDCSESSCFDNWKYGEKVGSFRSFNFKEEK